MRNAQIEHAPWHRGRLEDFYRVPQQRQVMSAGETANSRSHDCDALPSSGSGRQPFSCRIVSGTQVVALRGVALQRADRNRLVDLATPAGILAWVPADPAQDVRKRVRRAGQKVRFFIL